MGLILMLYLFGLLSFPTIEAAEVRRPTMLDFDRTRTEAAVVAVKPATAKPAAQKPTASAASAPTVAVAPKPAPAPSFATVVEKEILRLVNVERAKVGLNMLTTDSKLANIARAHSADMLKEDYFAHEDENGCDSSCRATNAGYAWRAVGENIYTMTGYDYGAAQAARVMAQGWMDSPVHRANILKEIYTNHGVGVAVDGSTVYATSMFATPR